jgi:GNAT superfamily N-acetyltransferase
MTTPAVRFRSAAEATAALALAPPSGLVLLSAPAAAAWPGAAAVAAMIARAAAEHPAVRHRAVLDCGHAPGLALDALRQGWRMLVLAPSHPAFAQVEAAAAELGAILLSAAPEALDLSRLDLRKPGGRAILARHLGARPLPTAAVAGGVAGRHPAAMPDTPFRIARVRSAADLGAVKGLFEAYAASLDIDLSFQDFAAELAGMPGRYAPPSGELLLARGGDGEPLGCVGLRSLGPGGCRDGSCCEMKRLYVSPLARGLGLGRALVDAVIAEAGRIGYREMRLDTLPSMAGAVALYERAGFVPVAPYYDTPVAGTIFLGRQLTG